MTLITVLGATGNLGSALVRQGTDRGLSIRAASRTIEPGAFESDVECVRVTSSDEAGFARVLTDVDIAVIAFPPSLAVPAEYPSQIRAVFEAARAADCVRVVGLVGSAGALTPHGHRLYETDYFEETTRHFYEGVNAAWDAYREQRQPDWVAFVPAARMQTHLKVRGVYRTRTDERLVTTDDASWRYFDTSQISYGDMAAAMLDEIERPTVSRRFVTVAY